MWTLFFDGSKSLEGAGVGCILKDLKGTKMLIACRLEFPCTNNTVEYEALVQGLRKEVDLKEEKIKVFGDSEIIVRQVRNTIHFLSSHLKNYQSEVWELIKYFTAFNINIVPRSLNSDVDLLENVASRLIPSNKLMPDSFSVELLYRPSIPNNIVSWRVFDDDQQLINFLHLKDTFKDSIIDEGQHDILMNTDNNDDTKVVGMSNNIPRSVVRLEKLYDLQDKFKKVTNCKTNISYLQFETVNLGSEFSPQNVNLGKNCSPEERQAYIKLFKEYKDIFTWMYEDLKTYDTNIIQHVIPMKSQTKPFQQKLRKMHPSLEPQVKAELNKLLVARIIFPVRHTQWISNLVPVRKKNGDIGSVLIS
jgi:ribonuclease HI